MLRVFLVCCDSNIDLLKPNDSMITAEFVNTMFSLIISIINCKAWQNN